MAHEGQELQGPGGTRLRFVRITEEVLEMEQAYPGEGPLPPPHLHPMQEERFEVLEGAVRAVIGDAERRYEQGEVFVVAAGITHQMGGVGAARIKWEVRPALHTAEFFEELYTGAAASDPAGFLERFADEFRLVAPG
jgi:quercetin dioxygenase-like cupin family protein